MSTEREELARLILGYDPRDLSNATPYDWQLWHRFLEQADAILAAGYRAVTNGDKQ